MKKYILFLLFFCFSATIQRIAAQSGKVFDQLTMTSKILGSERKYAIYLPPDYDLSKRNYPVLYLLHGGGDDQTAWIQNGQVNFIADKAIREGKATPMIIVMPDANTGKRGYFNDINGQWKYEDFFFQEFLPFIEKTYRIANDKSHRAITGQSMGGEGTFIYALHHPELFGSACPLSAGTGPLSLEDAANRLRRNNPNATDTDINTYFNRQGVLPIMNSMPDTLKKSIRWYMNVGDDDFLYEGNHLVHIAMRKKNIPHEFRVLDGQHNWTYWREIFSEVLDFVSKGFYK